MFQGLQEVSRSYVIEIELCVFIVKHLCSFQHQLCECTQRLTFTRTFINVLFSSVVLLPLLSCYSSHDFKKYLIVIKVPPSLPFDVVSNSSFKLHNEVLSTYSSFTKHSVIYSFLQSVSKLSFLFNFSF